MPSKLKVKIQKTSKKKDLEKGSLYQADKKTLDIFLSSSSSLEDIRRKLTDIQWKDIKEQEIEISTSKLNKSEKDTCYEDIRRWTYSFDKYKTFSYKGLEVNKSEKPKTQKVYFKSKYSNPDKAILDAVDFCRDMVNANASEITPQEMEKLAKEISKESKKQIRVKVINATQAKKMGMGCLLAVGRESSKDPKLAPRLVILEYLPKSKSTSKKSNSHTCLVGKGITYDTGGLCLKPNRYMLDMKSDMTGSATVLSVFKAIAKLPRSRRPKVKVTGIMALAENGFGADSYKPRDVLKAMNGKTVEVIDTDAEGRLVLADALSYASSLKDQPDLIIDLATLTGSIVSALGEIACGAMTNNETKLSKLIGGFDSAGEKVHQMPIFEEYKRHIKADAADLQHCNGRPDASVAALFLKEFIGLNEKQEIDWIHLDIAGVGFIENEGRYGYPGATGYGVRGLLNFLKSL